MPPVASPVQEVAEILAAKERALREALTHIVSVASGEKQVANDDTEGTTNLVEKLWARDIKRVRTIAMDAYCRPPRRQCSKRSRGSSWELVTISTHHMSGGNFAKAGVRWPKAPVSSGDPQ